MLPNILFMYTVSSGGITTYSETPKVDIYQWKELLKYYKNAFSHSFTIN